MEKSPIGKTLACLVLLAAAVLIRISFAAAQSTPSGEWSFLGRPSAPGGTALELQISPSNPQNIYALFQGENGRRLFRSQDGGSIWSLTNVITQDVSALGVDPQAENRVFAGGASGLYRSENAGISWTQVYTLGQVIEVVSPELIYVAGMASSDNPMVCYHGYARFARSQDGGQNWQVSDLGCQGAISSMAVNPQNTAEVYIGGAAEDSKFSAIWRSHDGGQTWDPPLTGFSIGYGWVQSLVIDPGETSILYASNYEGVFRSTDHGDHWMLVSALPAEPFLIAATGSDVIVVPTYVQPERRTFRSQDHGSSWWSSTAKLPDTVNVIRTSLNAPSKFFAGLPGFGVFQSPNYGSTWMETNNGIQTPVSIQAVAASTNPNFIFAGWNQLRGGLYRSQDGGLSWTTMITDHPIETIAVSPISASVAYAGGNDGLFVTDNGGEWNRTTWWQPVRQVKISGAGKIYFVGSYSNQHIGYYAFYQHSPEGLTYIRDLPLNETTYLSAVASHPENTDRVFAGGMSIKKLGTVYRSDDGGITWQAVLTNVLNDIADIQFSPFDSNKIYAVAVDAVYVSGDGGDTWQRRVKGINPFLDWPLQSLVLDDFGSPFLGVSNSGVYFWENEQGIWIGDGLAGQTVYDLDSIRGTSPFLLAGTDSGVWRRPLSPVNKTWLLLISR